MKEIILIKKEKGITLIALVVTILILLILAGIAISMITGEAGLFLRANQAATMYNEKSLNEGDRLNSLLSGNNNIQTIEEDIPELTSSNVKYTLNPEKNINPALSGSGVMVSITENTGSGYTLQYSLDGGVNYINYKAPFEVTEYNTIIIARLYNEETGKEGNTTATCTVCNIDTLAPNTFSFSQGKTEKTTITISASSTVTDEISENSGHSANANIKYKYSVQTSLTTPTWSSISEENSSSKTFTGLTVNTTYYIYMVAIDEAGNIREASNNGLEICTLDSNTNLALANGSFDTKALVNSPDVSKLNTSNFKYVTWIDNNGNNSNIVNPNEIAGTSAVPTKWHDYDTGQWANIKTYNGSYEAYWVWIPRFAYQIPASGGTGNEAEIKVKFINGTGTSLADGSGNAIYATDSILGGTGLTKDVDAKYKTNGSEAKWIVHPAFSFGDSTTDYSANTQLSGIWIAKFCASSNTPTATNGGGNTTNLKVMSVPGVLSWRSIILKNIWINVQAMTETGGVVVAKSGVTTSANVATIPISFIDTHPAKMMEWSAASILSQSAYGVYNTKSSTGYSSGENQAITYEGNIGTGDLQVWNNSRSHYTGYAASKKNGVNESKDANYLYNTVNGIKASTTGTVYGIYDMAGCSWEYVMGIYNGIESININNRPSLTNSYYRYYDNYPTSSRTTSGKIGDLTYETANTNSGYDNWNSDYAYFVISNYKVFIRGGRYYSEVDDKIIGVFAFNYAGADGSTMSSFRPILISV